MLDLQQQERRHVTGKETFYTLVHELKNNLEALVDSSGQLLKISNVFWIFDQFAHRNPSAVGLSAYVRRFVGQLLQDSLVNQVGDLLAAGHREDVFTEGLYTGLK